MIDDDLLGREPRWCRNGSRRGLQPGEYEQAAALPLLYARAGLSPPWTIASLIAAICAAAELEAEAAALAIF